MNVPTDFRSLGNTVGKQRSALKKTSYANRLLKTTMTLLRKKKSSTRFSPNLSITIGFGYLHTSNESDLTLLKKKTNNYEYGNLVLISSHKNIFPPYFKCQRK